MLKNVPENPATAPGIRIRPWRAGDAELIRDAASELSPRSLWRRFGVGGEVLPRPYLRMLERQPVGGDESAVVVAMAGDRVAGWAEWRPAGPGDAEIAAVVVDKWQRRGVGSSLIRALLADEKLRDRELNAYIHPENVPAHRLVASVVPEGFIRARADGYVRYTLAA